MTLDLNDDADESLVDCGTIIKVGSRLKWLLFIFKNSLSFEVEGSCDISVKWEVFNL